MSQFNCNLPVEIKTEIFKEACRSHPDSHRRTCPSTPSKLGMVCKHWRDIIATIPSVWATVNISYSPDRDRGSQKTCIERHLELSENLPLTISLSIWRPRYEKWTDAMIKEISYMYDTIMKESARVAELAINMNLSYLRVEREKFPELSLTKFPILETACFEGIEDFFPNKCEYYNLFENSPRLRKLSITNMEYAQDSLKCFRQITDLQLSRVTEQDCCDALFYLPQLEHAEFKGINDSDNFGRNYAEIVYPGGYKLLRHNSLRSLIITDTIAKLITLILNSLLCPSLGHLDLRELGKYSFESWNTDRDAELMESIEHFLKQAECSLHTLRIDTRAFGDKVWSIMDLTHGTIEKLHLEEGPAAHRKNIMPVLLDKLGLVTFLPRLRELHLGQKFNKSYDFERIWQTLIARRKISSDFSIFRAEMLDVWTRYDDGDVTIPSSTVVEGFNGLIREGMKISFKLYDTDHRFYDEFIDRITLL